MAPAIVLAAVTSIVQVADEAAVNGVAVQRQRGASVDRERRVGVGQRVAAQRRSVDHLQRAIVEYCRQC